MVKMKAVIQLFERGDGEVLAVLTQGDKDTYTIDYKELGRFKSVEHARWYLKLEFPDAEVKET